MRSSEKSAMQWAAQWMLATLLVCFLPISVMERVEHRSVREGTKSEEPVFSAEVAGKLLQQLRAGLEAHDPQGMLAAFDRHMPGHAVFKDQVRGFFESYGDFRVGYQMLQTWEEKDRGIVTVQFDLEAASADGGAPPIHKSAQLRFEFAHGPKGWKIIDLRPRNFFS